MHFRVHFRVHLFLRAWMRGCKNIKICRKTPGFGQQKTAAFRLSACITAVCFVVEMRGIEPLSERESTKLSPSAECV